GGEIRACTHSCTGQCPLSGVKRTLFGHCGMSAYDPFRSFTAVGGLLSYGSEQIENFRRAAIYADNILRGTKPSELPSQGPVKFVLSVNLKAAQALDLDMPFLLQQRADEVIE